MAYVNIGYGNVVNADKVISVTGADSAPAKRMIQTAKDNGKAIDATCGKKTKAIIIMENEMLVLSPLLPETIANRFNNQEETVSNMSSLREK